ncbi:MAG: hypothetical protein JWP89_2635 [Schlesneria sp.]|nr:hypothetical protein [Schlesneria sp.]
MKVTRFITAMKKADLLLMGFIVMLVLSFGVLTGYVPSPVVIMVVQQKELLDLSKLQLYLARETCKNGAKTETALSRCDRQAITDAISDIPNETFSTIAKSKL